MAKLRAGAKLSVFKGREARLNRAVFQNLALNGPHTIYDLHKQVRATKGLRYTRYASVNKRVKALEELGYVRRASIKKTKAGFEATVYELTARAYLVMLLFSTRLEDLIVRLDEATTITILASIILNQQSSIGSVNLLEKEWPNES